MSELYFPFIPKVLTVLSRRVIVFLPIFLRSVILAGLTQRGLILMESIVNKSRNERRRKKRLAAKLNKKQETAQQLVNNNIKTDSTSLLTPESAQINLKEKLGPIFEEIFKVCDLFIKLQKEQKLDGKKEGE